MAVPRFFAEDILRHANASGVNRIVLIQMSYYRFDNRYMLDVDSNATGDFLRCCDRGLERAEAGRRDARADAGARARFSHSTAGGSPGTSLDGDGFERMFRCEREGAARDLSSAWSGMSAGVVADV